MHVIRRVFVATVSTTALLMGGATAAQAHRPATERDTTQPATTRAADRATQSDNGILLPAPTGKAHVGTALLHLVDKRRRDTLTGASTRELMVQAWYPAKAGTGTGPAPYAPPGEVAELQRAFGFVPGAFEAITHSEVNATPARGRHPVVLFSHGLCGARTDSTIVAEDLASRGYLVLAIGTTGESGAVQFPDGRVVKTADPDFCTAGAAPFTTGKPILERLDAVRVADTRFVLDQLGRRGRHHHRDQRDQRAQGEWQGRASHRENSPLDQVRRVADLRRVGMYGHSFGGGTTASVMAVDRRVDAGVDLDGMVVGPVATKGVNRPFLVVGSSYHTPADDLSWRTFLPALRSWHRWYQVEQAGHYRFIDFGSSARHWRLHETMKPQDPVTWEQIFGDIDDAESQRINRDLVGGMFDRFLRGRHSPVLVNPGRTHPLVKDRTSEIDRDWG